MKRTKEVSQAELDRTGDPTSFGQVQDPQEASQGFAQPKGVKTRKAIANHLAKKQKMEDVDGGFKLERKPSAPMEELVDDSSGIKQWEKLIAISRAKTKVLKQERKRRLTSSNFISR